LNASTRDSCEFRRFRSQVEAPSVKMLPLRKLAVVELAEFRSSLSIRSRLVLVLDMDTA